MRICQFDDHRLGIVNDAAVRDVTAVLGALPAQRYPFPPGDLLIAGLPRLKDALSAAPPTTPILPLSQVRLLSPVANPGKIVAAPVNYRKHLEEVREHADLHHGNAGHQEEIRRRGLFLKATSSLIGASQPVLLRHPDRRTDHEVELAVIIGKTCSAVGRDRALEYVAGYAIGLDITIRGPEERSFRKSLDTYTVLGPWLVTVDELPDASALELALEINGETRQHANTRDLILSVPELIEFASSFYSLLPGDILLTGTPEGVAPIQPGDVMRASIEGIGEMTVQVAAA